ncbi:MAG: RNA pseudouridine synthase, partial [Leucobacter sp.]|nr:RNA pseudouridine synthase [Leucobacter sp.]
MTEHRSLPVPEGLIGQRVDSALASLLGFSRSFAAEVVQQGGVTLDGRVLAKSDRLHADGWLEVTWQEKTGPEIIPIDLPELAIVHDDDDIVVIDKPAGVAAHPSLGWQGPTVLGALAGAGFRIATSGPPERQGIVQRLDVGTSGLMVVAKSESAYSALKWAFRRREV